MLLFLGAVASSALAAQADRPTARDDTFFVIEATGPSELDPAANDDSSTGSLGAVQVYSAAVLSGGGSVDATSTTFPTTGTLTLDHDGVSPGAIILQCVIEDIGNTNALARVTSTATVTVISAASTAPEAIADANVTLSDLQTSDGRGFAVILDTALPASDEAITSMEYRVGTGGGPTWGAWTLLVSGEPELDTPYEAQSTAPDVSNRVELRLVSAVGPGASWPSSPVSIETGHAAAIFAEGGEIVFTLPVTNADNSFDLNLDTVEDAALLSAAQGAVQTAMTVRNIAVPSIVETDTQLTADVGLWIRDYRIPLGDLAFTFAWEANGTPTGATGSTITKPAPGVTDVDMTCVVTLYGVSVETAAVLIPENPAEWDIEASTDGSGEFTVNASPTVPATPDVTASTDGSGEFTVN